MSEAHAAEMPRPAEPRYLTDLEAGYEARFEARVVALPPGGVVLSESLFYPTGGGQPCDQGFLHLPDGSKLEVVDVGHQAGATLHRLARKGSSSSSSSASSLQRGMAVVGEIDWTRRHAHMRAHTGQHLLSALAFRTFQLRTDRSQVNARGGHFDLERPFPDPEAWKALGREANEGFFTRQVPVHLSFVSREEFERIPNRSGSGKLPAGVERVRLVTIGEADLAPCGGTHVRDTAEVGPVILAPPTPLPTGGVRVSFTLGTMPPVAPRDRSSTPSTPPG